MEKTTKVTQETMIVFEGKIENHELLENTSSVDWRESYFSADVDGKIRKLKLQDGEYEITVKLEKKQ